jgi:hypothetical protein
MLLCTTGLAKSACKQHQICRSQELVSTFHMIAISAKDMIPEGCNSAPAHSEQQQECQRLDDLHH